MIVKSVRLKNFRSHEEYFLECRKSTTLIVGENGCGKTSVLEAIYEALQGKSFKAVDREILRRGTEFYRIELTYDSGERVVVVYDGVKKRFEVGDKKFGRLPKKNRYPVVLFLPDDLNLVMASPSRKRDYFDRSFAQLVENYGDILRKYEKALKQRNELLKMEGVQRGAMFSWNVLLARYGCEVMRWRKGLVEKMNERLTEVYRTIAENEDMIWVEYGGCGMEDGGLDDRGMMGAEKFVEKSGVRGNSLLDESEYLRRLEGDFERDRVLGFTSFGVHRDNYSFIFNEVEAEGSASRGEVRSIVLALKFIEAEMILEGLGRRPVVLLDDVFSELDEKRQKCLVRNFKGNQVIITSVEGV